MIIGSIEKKFEADFHQIPKNSNSIFGFIFGNSVFVDLILIVNWQNQLKICNFGCKRCIFLGVEISAIFQEVS